MMETLLSSETSVLIRSTWRHIPEEGRHSAFFRALTVVCKALFSDGNFILDCRDTTVQTLTLQPTVRDGVVVYEDSPLVQAVKYGHVLIVDEADKAPTHVTCILKVRDIFQIWICILQPNLKHNNTDAEDFHVS
jgi:hypothetical protein